MTSFPLVSNDVKHEHSNHEMPISALARSDQRVEETTIRAVLLRR